MEGDTSETNPCQKVKESCKIVMRNAYHVKINQEKLQKLATQIQETEFKYLTWEECHFKITEDVTTEQIIAYVVVVDTLNFCFWPTAGFEYDNLTSNLTKLLKEDPDFFKSERLAKVTTEDVKTKIFTEDF